MFPAPKKGRKERRARGGGEREKKFAVIAPGRENCEDGWTGGRTRPVAAKNLQVLSFPREMEESSARRCGGRIYTGRRSRRSNCSRRGRYRWQRQKYSNGRPHVYIRYTLHVRTGNFVSSDPVKKYLWNFASSCPSALYQKLIKKNILVCMFLLLLAQQYQNKLHISTRIKF